MKQTYDCLTAKTATGAGNAIQTQQFQYAVIRITVSGTVNMTVSVKASADTNVPPTFSSASSNTNPWFYVGVINQDTTLPIAGSTGITLTVAGTYSYTVNADALEYVTLDVTNYTSGTINATVTLTENV